MSRWVRVQTSIFDHELFAAEPFSEREAWIWIIAKAAWKETSHRIGASVHKVPAGSMFVTVREMQASWRWTSTRRVAQFLQLLASQNMIETHSETGKTLITVCNYSRYQNVETPSETPAPSEAKQKRNTKDTITPSTDTSSSFHSEDAAQAPRKRAHRMPDDFHPNLDEAVAAGMTLSQAKAEADAIRDWSKSSPNGAKLDWPATWRSWVRRAVKDRPQQRGQSPPGRTKSDFRQHQDGVKQRFDDFLGIKRDDDEFTSEGPAFDLKPGDWRPH
jgi:hypothetical protein